MSLFVPRTIQILIPIDGGKLASAFGQKSSNWRNSCSTLCFTRLYGEAMRFRLYQLNFGHRRKLLTSAEALKCESLTTSGRPPQTDRPLVCAMWTRTEHCLRCQMHPS